MNKSKRICAILNKTLVNTEKNTFFTRLFSILVSMAYCSRYPLKNNSSTTDANMTAEYEIKDNLSEDFIELNKSYLSSKTYNKTEKTYKLTHIKSTLIRNIKSIFITFKYVKSNLFI